MARWMASEVPEWVSVLVFLVGLPVVMLVLQTLVRRVVPNWERGEHNDAAGVMLSAAVVVYSIAIGLCVITLWEKMDAAHRATEVEAGNLAALAEGSRVFDDTVQNQIRDEVVAYNRDVVDGWSLRVRGEAVAGVGGDLDGLVDVVGRLTPETQAQRAYVDDAVARLASASELRTVSVRLARDQQLPNILWVAVLGGSLVVLGLSLTCGVRDRLLQRILMAGVTVTVGINLFLVIELNYPFYGVFRVGPESYANVVETLRR